MGRGSKTVRFFFGIGMIGFDFMQPFVPFQKKLPALKSGEWGSINAMLF